MGWHQVLDDAGVAAVPDGPRQLRLVFPSGVGCTVRLVTVTGPLRPSWVRTRREDWEAGSVLIAAGSATRAAVDAVHEAGQSVVAGNGWVSLQAHGERVDREPVSRRPPASQRGPVPWGGLTVVRRLLEAGPLTQGQLATAAGVGQPLVSKALAGYQVGGLVVRTVQGWQAADGDRLLQVWLDRYPGAGGLTSHWYAMDALSDQLARAVRAHRGRRLVLSGDLAADRIAAWRIPGRIHLYCTEPADLLEHGFVQSGDEEATLVLTAPQDPGVFVPGVGEGPERASADVWAASDTSAGPVELADPVQILVDVASAPGPDVVEAAAVVREAVLSESSTARLRDWLLSTGTISMRAGGSSTR